MEIEIGKGEDKMPIKVQNNLPAKQVLEHENIFVMDENRAMTQDIRPLQIAILNLMPLKEDTEVQLLRCLSNTPLQVDITFMSTASYIGKNTVQSHLDNFYVTWDEVKHRNFDGLIITGAPVEQMEFEEVAYWEELKDIMEWSKTHVTSTLHICWGAQAGLYYHYGVQKHLLDKKLFGVYEHNVYHRRIPIMRGFDDRFFAPHSRHTDVEKKDIEALENIIILADSEEAGVFLAMEETGKQFFMFGHPEYDRLTLDKEYHRDLDKGLPIEIPKNYYPDDTPGVRPIMRWRAHSNAIYTNWLNYYVYQNTPFEL